MNWIRPILVVFSFGSTVAANVLEIRIWFITSAAAFVVSAACWIWLDILLPAKKGNNNK